MTLMVKTAFLATWAIWEPKNSLNRGAECQEFGYRSRMIVLLNPGFPKRIKLTLGRLGSAEPGLAQPRRADPVAG